ncbi:unnamed protein product [Cunninghamella echinulata]
MVCIEDHSKNGTFLNGVKIKRGKTMPLFPGCVITFSHPSISFCFHRMNNHEWNDLTPMTIPTYIKLKRNDNNTADAGDTTSSQMKKETLMISKEIVGCGGQSIIYLCGTTFPSYIGFVCKKFKPIKTLGPQLTHEKEKMLREIKLLKSLNHPNIISLIHYQENDEGTYSLIFPAFCGGNLQDYLNDNKLTEDKSRYILYQLCKATEYLHDNNIIHRGKA